MSTKQIENSAVEIQVPNDVKVSLKGSMLHVQGPLGKVYKSFKKIPVLIEINDNKILLKKTGERKKHLAILNTSKSLIQTLCVGVVDGFTIKMKIVYSHFPITVKAEGKNVLIENYKVVRLGKNITECLPNQKIGEFLGIIKLSKKGAMYFLEKYLKLKNSHKGVFHSSPSFQKAYLTDMLQEIVDSKIIVDPIITKGLWMEIDTTEDLKRAENLLKN